MTDKGNLLQCLGALAKRSNWQRFWPGVSKIQIRKLKAIQGGVEKVESQLRKIEEVAKRQGNEEILALLEEKIEY